MNVEIQELEIADFDILENIKTALYRLWKFKLVVVLMTLVGLLAAVIYISIVGISTNYRSAATIYSMMYGSYEDSTDGVKVMNTYASLLGSANVCERAAAMMQDPEITADVLRNMVSYGQIALSGASTDSKSYGYKLTLIVTSSTQENVLEITNAMAKAFVGEINDLIGSQTLQVMDYASKINIGKSISIPVVTAIFGILAFVMTCGVIFIVEFFSSRVYSVAQCEAKENQILGLIPYQK